jgi:DNA-binding transcriptional LysR family regulator
MKVPNLHLSQLRALLAIADGGSFTVAAEQLEITQSAVSQGIAALEGALGGMLIERDRTGARLTDLGERVARHAREILAHTENIRQEAAAARGLARGKVRIGSFPSVSAAVLPPLLGEYRSRYPGIQTVIMEGGDSEVRQWLKDRVIDLGVLLTGAGDRRGAVDADGVTTVPLGRDEWMAVLPKGHRLAARSTVPLVELGREPFVLLQGGCSPQLLDFVERAGVRLQVQYEIRDQATVWTLVRERFGVTIVSELALSSDREGLVVRRLSPQGFRTFGLARLQGVSPSPAVTAFLALVAERRSASAERQPRARAPRPRARRAPARPRLRAVR